MICKPTDYAIGQGAWTNEDNECWWWLRTIGYPQNCAADIYSKGGYNCAGSNVEEKFDGVRPALWIELD